MKISMWMLADELSGYETDTYITAGDRGIESVAFLEDGFKKYEPRYVYIGRTNHYFEMQGHTEGQILVNRHSYIIVYDISFEELMYVVLKTFEKYNAWEQRVRMALLTDEPFQNVVNECTAIFKNPVCISDMQGNCLGLTRELEGWTPDEDWEYRLRTGKLPLELLSSQERDRDGKKALDWTEHPAIYQSPQRRYIGFYLSVEGEKAAGCAINEAIRRLSERDIQIAENLCSLIGESRIMKQKLYHPLTSENMFLNSLKGGLITDEQEKLFEGQFTDRFCSLVLIRTPGRINQSLRKTLLEQWKNEPVRNIALDYEGDIVALLPYDDVQKSLNHLLPEPNRTFWAGVSLPFRGLERVHFHLEQLRQFLFRTVSEPGIYYFHDYAMQCFADPLQQNRAALQPLIHPAIVRLQEHDAAHNSELCRTLFVYLVNNQNLIRTAADLYIHRNSLIYRIKKISALMDCDLDNPFERFYLLLSFFLIHPQCYDAYNTARGNRIHSISE